MGRSATSAKEQSHKAKSTKDGKNDQRGGRGERRAETQGQITIAAALKQAVCGLGAAEGMGMGFSGGWC